MDLFPTIDLGLDHREANLQAVCLCLKYKEMYGNIEQSK